MSALRTYMALAVLTLMGQEPTKTSFSVLASFDYTEGMTLPKEVTDLDEVTVTISGFMRREVPGGSPVHEFMLVNDSCGCTGTPISRAC